MGWAFCGQDDEGRDIGYGVVATCDQPGCEKEIDRGLDAVCGEMHGGEPDGCCGRYFCGEHLYYGVGLPAQMCDPCSETFRREHPEVIEAAIAEWEKRYEEHARSRDTEPRPGL